MYSTPHAAAILDFLTTWKYIDEIVQMLNNGVYPASELRALVDMGQVSVMVDNGTRLYSRTGG